ncbi:MAG: MoaD/ThiS family protein [Sandaracinus sp.]|nr:MoaD/ThiS family protein [Sandaracinus sp.]MCB9615449.1 MoaD/ThiS family protein [Sandaracinus sp.]MCB9622620.1 MoaD/ThiS family protein [Sandaracinus sp.]
MTNTLRIPPALRSLTGGETEIAFEAASVRALIDQAEAKHPGLKARICDDSGKVLRFVNLFVNDEDIRMLDGLDTELRSGDSVSIIPAIAGGR